MEMKWSSLYVSQTRDADNMPDKLAGQVFVAVSVSVPVSGTNQHHFKHTLDTE